MTDDRFESALRDRFQAGPAAYSDPARAHVALHNAKRIVAKRRQRRSTGLTIGAVVALLAALTVGTRGLRPSTTETASSAAGSSISDWTIRGNLVQDLSLINRAKQTVTTQSIAALRPATVSRAIYAGSLSDSSYPIDVIILIGQSRGQTVLAYVTTLLQPNGTAGVPPLVLRSLVPVDLNKPVESVGFLAPVAHNEYAVQSWMTNVLAITLVAPNIHQAAFHSSLIDSEMSDNSSDAIVKYSGLVIDQTFSGVGPWNSTVTTDASTKSTSILGGGLRDPSLVTGSLVISGTTNTATLSGVKGLKIGDLVVTNAGVVGFVHGLAASTGIVSTDLSKLTSVGIKVHSYYSNYLGTMGGTRDNPTYNYNRATPAGVNRLVVDVSGSSAQVSLGIVRGSASPWPVNPSVTNLPHSVPVPVWVLAR